MSALNLIKMKVQLQNPYIITIISLVLFYAIMKLPVNLIFDNFELSVQQSNNMERLIKNSMVIALAVFAIKKFNFIKLSGLSRLNKFQNKYLILVPLYLVVLGIFFLIGTDLTSIYVIDAILLGLAMLSVGFVEEFIFRGFIQSLFLQKFIDHKNGILIGLFIPALVFGLLHVVNLDTSNIAATMGQVIYAFMIGFSFGVILLKTNKLIPLAIIHGLIDFVFSVNTLLDDNLLPGDLDQQNIGDALGSVIAVLPLFIVSLFVLRKVTKIRLLAKLD